MATIVCEPPRVGAADSGPIRCPRCHGPLARTSAGFECRARSCGASLPVRDGVIIAGGASTDDNKIAADFYDNGQWRKVRPWETLFWRLNGGERRARDVVLRRLPKGPGVRLLDVAIGDGVYTSWLPEGWPIVGIDISISQLAACQRRNSGRDLTLILGEAEDMPFPDRQFDAVLSIGGFNHFNDPEKALSEMARVAKPGAPVIVSDETPESFNIGYRLGLPKLNHWIAARVLRMGDDFADLVERHRNIDIAAIGRRVLADSRYELIWRGEGYLLTGAAP